MPGTLASAGTSRATEPVPFSRLATPGFGALVRAPLFAWLFQHEPAAGCVSTITGPRRTPASYSPGIRAIGRLLDATVAPGVAFPRCAASGASSR
jgi:hypothetical protein